MLSRILKDIEEKVLKEQPKYGSIEILLAFHDGKFAWHEFKKTEKILLKQDAGKSKPVQKMV